MVAVNADYGLGIEIDIPEVTVNKLMELQLEVLDLVYYMIYEGYNIVPWWSDGVGHWDDTLVKDWDKTDTSNTRADNLVQQLSDIGLAVDVQEMQDIGTKNFLYYQTLINTDLNNKVLKLVNTTSTEKYLTLGKSKRGSGTFDLQVGNNVFFYDGIEDMFDVAVRDQIGDKIVHTLKWIPQDGKWIRFTDDTDLYFYEDVAGSVVPMPYIFIINVDTDCTINIDR
jgi:hypothetical protein